jgi:Domain of unknown function DUF488
MQTSKRSPVEDRPQSSGAGLSGHILTIGHSNHTTDQFIELLRRAEVTALADVRSSPFSQRFPQFNQSELQRALATSGIRYLFLGDELGGRPSDVAVYDAEGRVDYWRVRRTAIFRAGIERLLQESRNDVVCMMCAEEDPLDCHRALMVAAELVERGVSLSHVRGDGTRETTKQLESRLFDITGIGGGMATGLFAASMPADERAALLTDAYKEQAKRKAFRLPPGQDISAIDSISEWESFDE